MRQVNCLGTEWNIFDCDHVLGGGTCDVSEAAAVTCVPMDSDEPESKLVTVQMLSNDAVCVMF